MEQATIAVFRVSVQKSKIGCERDEAYKSLVEFCAKHKTPFWQNDTLLECVMLLPVPNKLPILCQCVANAQTCGHNYKVELFGQSILQFSSESQQ